MIYLGYRPAVQLHQKLNYEEDRFRAFLGYRVYSKPVGAT